MKLYKLTSQDMKTYNNFQWNIGEKRIAKGLSDSLCTDGLLHAYRDPYLALLLNTIHAAIPNPRLWEIEASPILASDWGKVGTKEQTLVKELFLSITVENRVEFAIRCALTIKTNKNWRQWAKNWLNGIDRTYKAANAAADAAAYAAIYAADAAADAAIYAADAADAAAYAANAAADAAANAAAFAANAAANAAADAAAYAANAAANAAADANTIMYALHHCSFYLEWA